jgi:transcriptional activator protein UGA3
MCAQQLNQCSEDLAFANTSRSRSIVHEIWTRNENGKLFVDWLDVIKEWEWELWLV